MEKKYFLTMVDDYTRFTGIVLLRGTHEAQTQIQKFINLTYSYQSKVKIVRSDNGLEFSLHSFYAKKEIEHKKIGVGTP